MEMEIDIEPPQTDQQMNFVLEKRRTHVGCWKNKEEFIKVYKWLFDENSNNETKQLACKQMKIWKLRRLNLTPASILSTLLLVEIHLKDSNFREKNNVQDHNELRISYASTFTRFFNYMSSIMQTKNMKTMYEIAKELGLESFIVDLRHICAHGQNLPELSILRRSSEYCLKWLKGHYWDHEVKNMINTTSKDIRINNVTAFDDNVTDLFQLYDITLEAQYNYNCQIINDSRKKLPLSAFNSLKKYSNAKGENNLKLLSRHLVRDLSKLVKREPGLKDLSQICIEALMKMNFFFKAAAIQTKTVEDEYKLICLNNDLFRTIATYGFIDELFFNLIVMCENENEINFKRMGSNYWAYKIVEGFVAFKRLKIFYKNEKEKNPKFRINVNTINTNFVAKDILEIYTTELNVDCGKTLLIGDTLKRPWLLEFSHQYIQERLSKISVYTANVVKSCLQLMNPPLSNDTLISLTKIIEIYNSNTDDGNDSSSFLDNSESNINKIYDISSEMMKNINNSVKSSEQNKSISVIEKHKIWKKISDNQDWNSCPLGRLIWE